MTYRERIEVDLQLTPERHEELVQEAMAAVTERKNIELEKKEQNKLWNDRMKELEELAQANALKIQRGRELTEVECTVERDERNSRLHFYDDRGRLVFDRAMTKEEAAQPELFS